MHNHEFLYFLPRILRSACSFMSVIFWLLLIYGFDEPATAGLTVVAALIHEAGHILCISLLAKKGPALRGVPSGLRLCSAPYTSYRDEILTYASGPLANIFVCLPALLLLPLSRDYAYLFIFLNLATAGSNLLPIKQYDGYGILTSLLRMNSLGTRWVGVLSFTIKCTATLAALYLMERLGEGYWLFSVFFFSLLAEIGESPFLKK